MSTLKRHWFPLTLAFGLIIYELVFAWFLVLGDPVGTDLSNNVFLTQEVARWAATIALAYSIHAAARTVAKDEREARLASLLATGGIGLGWLHSAVLGVTSEWSPLSVSAPDLASGTAIVPTLLGGADGILMVAFLIYVMQGVWDAIHRPARRTLPVLFAIALLTSFHPTVIPLIATAIILAWAKQIGKDRTHHQPILHPVLLLASLLPSIGFHLWLFVDPTLRSYRPEQTMIPLAPWDAWVFMLLPAALAMAWIAAHHTQRRLFLKTSRWCLAWIVAAAILTLVLPVPWRSAFTDGLMVPLVFLTIPFWSALTDAIPKLARVILITGLVSASPLHLFASQYAWFSTL